MVLNTGSTEQSLSPGPPGGQSAAAAAAMGVLSRLALLCHHPHPCHLLRTVRDHEMGQQPEKGWRTDSGLSGTFAHTRPPSRCTHPGTGRQQAKKDAWSTCPGASLPTALPSAPPCPNPQFIPHLLSAPCITFSGCLSQLFAHGHFFPTFPMCTKVTIVLRTLVLKMMQPG